MGTLEVSLHDLLSIMVRDVRAKLDLSCDILWRGNLHWAMKAWLGLFKVGLGQIEYCYTTGIKG